jgi:putative transcriptional regulator
MLDSKKNLHLKIREIRLEAGLTQEQFATKIGVSFPTVNRWENQKAKPSPLALQKLQKIFLSLKKRNQLKHNPDNEDEFLYASLETKNI